MSRIFITGSSDGLGRAAAQELIARGHEVVVHARSEERARTLRASLAGAAAIVVGDLASAAQTSAIAEQVNAIGRMDAVIHNAGIYLDHSTVVNVSMRQDHELQRPGVERPAPIVPFAG